MFNNYLGMANVTVCFGPFLPAVILVAECSTYTRAQTIHTQLCYIDHYCNHLWCHGHRCFTDRSVG